MALPVSYENNIQLYESRGIDLVSFFYRLQNSLDKDHLITELSSTEIKVLFNFRSFLGIHFQIEVQKTLINQNSIGYEIKLSKLLQVCIALILFIAFFSGFKFGGFLWFSVIFTLLFYFVNVLIVDRQVQSIIKSAIDDGDMGEGNEEMLTQKQLEWMNNKTKCPACGEDITEYDMNCPECGLRISDKAKPKPYDLSKYVHKNIKYFFKQKKKG
jgi:hypothetical protein